MQEPGCAPAGGAPLLGPGIAPILVYSCIPQSYSPPQPCPLSPPVLQGAAPACLPHCAYASLAAQTGPHFLTPPSPPGPPRCVSCPAGTTTLTPGTASELRCLPPGEVDEELDGMFAPGTLIKKLVAMPALEQKVPKSE